MSWRFPPPNPRPRDPEILKAIQTSEVEAARLIFDRDLMGYYHMPVYAYSYSALWQWNAAADPLRLYRSREEVAREATANTEIRLWKRLRNGTPFEVFPGRTFWAYVESVVNSAVSDCYPRRSAPDHRPTFVSLDNMGDVFPEKAAARSFWDELRHDAAFSDLLSRQVRQSPPIGQHLGSLLEATGEKGILTELAELLRAELKKRGPRERDCYILSVVFALSYQEIAAGLRISRGAVGGYITKAWQAFAEPLCRYLAAHGYTVVQIADLLRIKDKLDAQGDVVLDRFAQVRMLLDKDDTSAQQSEG